MEPTRYPNAIISQVNGPYLVPGEGLEPTRIAPADFKSAASASSAIPANLRNGEHYSIPYNGGSALRYRCIGRRRATTNVARLGLEGKMALRSASSDWRRR